MDLRSLCLGVRDPCIQQSSASFMHACLDWICTIHHIVHVLALGYICGTVNDLPVEHNLPEPQDACMSSRLQTRRDNLRAKSADYVDNSSTVELTITGDPS